MTEAEYCLNHCPASERQLTASPSPIRRGLRRTQPFFLIRTKPTMLGFRPGTGKRNRDKAQRAARVWTERGAAGERAEFPRQGEWSRANR